MNNKYKIAAISAAGLAFFAAACGQAPVDSTTPNGNEVPEAVQPTDDQGLRDRARERATACVEALFNNTIDMQVSPTGMNIDVKTVNGETFMYYSMSPLLSYDQEKEATIRFTEMDPPTQQRLLEMRACVETNMWVPIAQLREEAAREAAEATERARNAVLQAGQSRTPAPGG